MDTKWKELLEVGEIHAIKPVAGGDINDNYQVIAETGEYFLKVQPETDADFFEAEAMGLEKLNKVVNTPTVLKTGETDSDAFLLMTYVEPGNRSNPAELGEQLAQIHRQTADAFGLEEDNYIGSLPQYNGWKADWAEFYIENRLQPQIDFTIQNGYWNANRETQWQRLAEQIRKTYTNIEVEPSLLHGDLWGGNVLFNRENKVTFIDPAVYYGDREVDIAMTKLFGSFDDAFYEAYQKNYPLRDDADERIAWYQLYYLLVHLNVFGTSYLGSIDRILKSY
ncbi:fructosamine kinase family protein [Listeria grayi]|uniref:Fructosamine kinase n=1 Tax=Listeria grayi DSM 20601 TaxID=525367 RepID=D7UWX8_LISGR|nr:fructosamine kinase family protein [Listeria grayi]EFI84186.1 fructosamine kinase [Listeria grayi DSM 20601]